ncbi:acetoin dehydrogenase dihydrolipoyllysine-residue acetyltransferase subunit [Ancylobacter vacuolatus]|uniref:Pyruvate dehydrogenase E2 component (Dihydrolipoamide acetyltransferase) n=1 Tax=Ancylobacter vacuolatus TaxID=223389 RepID=A0ABU0DKF2_9HYPH|nr:acetoin dehydrogenase dihydrolipoyllysine-residue acetyltransferase subunit [Ancylobacter vacuolatus]MDQ0348884.1 pyruvate dehydrogenase E2 component (dihydrolipoamide acetyltransferase) [Ancylobacter vacuolatus]
MNERIKPVVMPKWGLSMSEGKVTGWLKPAGAAIAPGDEIVEVETDKIAGVVEAHETGTLRRVIGAPDTVYPVKALLGIIADDAVPDAEIDAYVAEYATQAAAEAAKEEAPRYHFIDTPAGRLRYARRGEGAENVILIHGFGGDLDNWLFNIDALAEVASVYALDLPGHGQSDKKLADPSLTGLSTALLGFMDALAIDRAHLVGHSMGGAIAARTALDAAGRVASVTLIGSAGLGPEINAGYTDGFVQATSRRDLKPVLEQLFHDPETVTRQLVDDLLKYKRLDGVAEVLTALSGALFAGGRQAERVAEPLAATDVPALVIAGASDKVIPATHAQALGARATVEVIEGAGHMVQMEKAGRVNELILAHIA